MPKRALESPIARPGKHALESPSTGRGKRIKPSPEISRAAVARPVWRTGQQEVVTWSSQGEVPTVNICLHRAPTAPLRPGGLPGRCAFVKVLACQASNSGSHEVLVPSGLTPGQYIVRINSSVNSSVVTDSSEFSVVCTGGTPVISGVMLQQLTGARQQVTWSSQGEVPAVDICLHHALGRRAVKTLVRKASNSSSHVGSRVGLRGLTGRPELDGLRGFVVSWDATSYGVKLDDARMLSVQRANLQVVWGKLEAHVSWVARVTRAPRIIRPQLWIDLVREVGSDFMIFSDLFFEPEAFAMLQYAVEAQVVHWFAMQQALLHHRRSSQESGCVVLESTAQCIPPDDACLRESGRWAAGPIAIGQVPQESDNWWMPRAVVLVPNTPTASALVWQDQALVGGSGRRMSSATRFG